MAWRQRCFPLVAIVLVRLESVRERKQSICKIVCHFERDCVLMDVVTECTMRMSDASPDATLTTRRTDVSNGCQMAKRQANPGQCQMQDIQKTAKGYT
jgi:hypothetical protein